jgi:hypothetical protein
MPTGLHHAFLAANARQAVKIMLVTLVAASTGGIVLAQSSAGFDLSWYVLSGGGGARQSANYLVADSLGALVGEISTGASVQVVSGFPQGIYMAAPTPTPTPDPRLSIADIFEDDNRCDAARTIDTAGAIQQRNFHADGDEDWVQFAAAAGTAYRIEVETDQASTADVVVELYPDCTSPASTTLSPTFSPGVRVDFTAPETRAYLVRLRNCPGCPSNSAATYRLSVRNLASATSATGDAAIILAGRLRAGDQVQANIHFVTNAAYDLFTIAGYDADHIQYLATDPALPGYDGAATLANLQDAIVNWARQRVVDNGMLTLYLVNHGEHDVFYVDEVTGQRLTPSDLHAWLSQLESERPDKLRINIFVEACNSGSFIDPANGSISKIGRVVVASTNATNVAYASKTGAHFSDQFVGSLRQGRHIFSSFVQAQTSILQTLPVQTPWLDDNGDALANSNDGVLASQRAYIYSTNLVETATLFPPAIFQATIDATGAGSRHAIRADVRDDKGITRVWAAIYPPSYRPPESGSELVPESVPLVELSAQGGDLFAGEYEFGERGNYRVVVHAQDVDRLDAQPKSLSLTTGGSLYLPRIHR